MTTAAAMPRLAAAAPGRAAQSGPILWASAIALLFIALHHNFLWRMFHIATDRWEGDWSHALVIPFISAFFVWQRRDDLARTPLRRCWPALPLMLLGVLSYAWWIYPGRNDMFQGYSMIFTLFALVLFLLGPRAMRILWLPIGYLVLAVKVADRIWDAIAWKLQIIASHAASVVLNFCGLVLDLEAHVSGSTIELAYTQNGVWTTYSLNVAEACSGLRMLAAFIALGVAVAFLAKRAPWQRVVLVFSTVPIAVLVNVGRVTTLGLLHLIDPELAAGDVHKFIGLIMLGPALALFLLLGWVLDQIFLPDPRNTPGINPAPTTPATTPPAHACASASPTPAPASALPPRPLLALLLGVILALLCGLGYGLTLAALKPSLLGENVTRTVAGGLLAGAVILLLVALWSTRKFFRPRGQAGRPLLTGAALATGVLLAAAGGLHAVVNRTQAVLLKKPIPLRQPLVTLPALIGPYEMVHDERLSAEILEELRTENYIVRTYRDTRLAENDPKAILRLHVAYYTGTPDTVPHVPERCYVAGGLQPIDKRIVTLDMNNPQWRHDDDGVIFAFSRLADAEVRVPRTDAPATLFTFGMPNDPSQRSSVLYFFAANGKFLPTPDHVRLQGFDLRDEFSYYCKIEVGAPLVADTDVAIAITGTYLAEVLPEILACLPDWSEVLMGRWPPGAPGAPGAPEAPGAKSITR